MWKKIKVWRKQLLCVGTGMFLGAAAWILQERDPVIKEGNVLERPAADESYQEQELYVRGLVEKGGDIPFDLRIQNIIQKKKLITYIKKYWIRSLK